MRWAKLHDVAACLSPPFHPAGALKKRVALWDGMMVVWMVLAVLVPGFAGMRRVAESVVVICVAPVQLLPFAFLWVPA